MPYWHQSVVPEQEKILLIIGTCEDRGPLSVDLYPFEGGQFCALLFILTVAQNGELDLGTRV